MEYAQNQASAAMLNQARPMPELGRLKMAAERVGIAHQKIGAFIDRFHGPVPEAASTGPGGQNPDSYRNDLECLFIQIERLENMVAALDGIG